MAVVVLVPIVLSGVTLVVGVEVIVVVVVLVVVLVVLLVVAVVAVVIIIVIIFVLVVVVVVLVVATGSTHIPLTHTPGTSCKRLGRWQNANEEGKSQNRACRSCRCYASH